MNITCPSCNKLVNLVSVDKSENVTVTTYSCGHKLIELFLEEKIRVKESLRIKLKDQKEKTLLESKVNEQTEKRISRKPSKAIQLVFKKDEIVHIHCKDATCGNEWKIKESNDWTQKFDVLKNQHGTWIITCKKCRRNYLSG